MLPKGKRLVCTGCRTKKEILNKLNKCKKEIKTLRHRLNQINEEKESWFKRKLDFSKSISRLIGKVKNFKFRRDKTTKEVKVEKSKRDKFNEEIRARISEFKKLNQIKIELQKKLGIKDDPSVIKDRIAKLETVIETEAISFDKEKQIMKEIKDLKKKFTGTKEMKKIFERADKLSKEIDRLKKESDELHKDVQGKAKESQETHEEMILVSKEVDELRRKEEVAFKKFLETKKGFTLINEKLKEKLMEMGKINQKLGEVKTKFVSKKERKVEAQLKEKEAIVQEKIKKGEKLTTQDLIIMQGLKK